MKKIPGISKTQIIVNLIQKGDLTKCDNGIAINTLSVGLPGKMFLESPYSGPRIVPIKYLGKNNQVSEAEDHKHDRYSIYGQ